MSEIPLQGGLSGQACALLVSIRSSLAVGSSAIRTFTALGGNSESNGLIDVVNQSKVSLLGSGALSPQYIRYHQSTIWLPSSMPAVVPLYWIFFGGQAVRSIVTGFDAGGQRFTGFEFLRLTPGTGFTTGT